jgi:chromosome segregation ATPase
MAATATQTQQAEDETLDETAGRDGGEENQGQTKQTQAQPTVEELQAELDRTKAETERLKKAQAETNRKAAADRNRLADIDRQEEERKAAEMSEAERVRKNAEETARKLAVAEERATSAERQLQEFRISIMVEREAGKAGFQYPEDVYRLIDREMIEVDGETSKITGVKQAVEKLAKERPGILSAQRGGGTPPRETPRYPNRQQPSGSGATPEARAEEQLIQTGAAPYQRF